LEFLNALRAEIFNERTDINRQADQRKSTIKQLQDVMPAAPAVTGNLTDLQNAIEDAATERDLDVQKCDTHLQRLRAARDEQIAGLQAQIQNLRDVFSQAEVRCTEKKAEIKAKYEADTSATRSALAGHSAALEATAKRTQAESTIAQMHAALATLEADAAARTERLAAIDAYKAELLADLPIPGLTFENGDVYRHGVVLDQLNTAQQVEIAFAVASLRAGELGMVCVDRIEALDADSYDAFQREATKSGLQLFVSRVADAPPACR
jgi:DNA repair exonuclease SbcCD ATPase subunit